MADFTSQVMAESTASPPSDEALAIMRLSVVDWMACGIAGQSEPVAQVLAGLLDEEGGNPQATCFGGTRRPARAAALYNGTVSHALDYDDTHFAHIGHVSVAVVSAALAQAERNSLAMGPFIATSLAGCEAAIRMGLLLGRTHYQVGFHQTATAGCFGAALAATLQDTADTTQHRHALGLAATRASGLKSQFGTMGKPYNAGLAAANGVEAALLAGRGMIADPNGWDAFVQTHHGEGVLEPSNGFLMPDVSHKFHACCHGLHAALEALELLKPLEVSQIERIDIQTHPRWMSVCNKPSPKTGLEAKFSYKAVMALSLLGHVTAALTSFDDQLVVQAEVTTLADKVHVFADASLSEMESVVSVDGKISAYDLGQPMPFEHREPRVRNKAEMLLGKQRADSVWTVVHGDDAMPVAELAALM